ncbi:hypothetical protein F0562_005961 [Nyssa sinensis]|uniref:Uncharacterized protein n=1 Tax=Nyssa sinensis TaxID=561372 RepID=A0A5J5ANA1_9ASTE|nr:hypothetical protein F0562_005961 [Nyssa sinensis]
MSLGVLNLSRGCRIILATFRLIRIGSRSKVCPKVTRVRISIPWKFKGLVVSSRGVLIPYSRNMEWTSVVTRPNKKPHKEEYSETEVKKAFNINEQGWIKLIDPR